MTKNTLFILALTVFMSCNNDKNTESMEQDSNLNTESPSLKSILDEKKEKFNQKADKEKIADYNDGIASVENSGILDKALTIGDEAPNFVLKNAAGNSVELKEYLKKGKVVLIWYRGGWCPYCNLTLRHLQEELPNFQAQGASLIALTPELPDNSLSTKEKNNLDFEVLSDIGNKVAHTYGIVYSLTDKVAERYNAGFGMEKYNGNTSNQLPLAATYVIDENGKILYAFLDADYRNRAEPSEITDFLKTNNSK